MNFQQIAQHYNNEFGFNILPLIDKAPIGDWIKWQKDIMTSSDINSFNWKKINGIGAVCGINNLRCLDFDSVTDPDIVKKFLRALGLPSEYAWTVRSGSGKGYHIWFYCNDDSYLFRILGERNRIINYFPPVHVLKTLTLPALTLPSPRGRGKARGRGKENVIILSCGGSAARLCFRLHFIHPEVNINSYM